MIKFANTSNRGRVCLFSQNRTTILSHSKVKFRLVLHHYCVLWVYGRYCVHKSSDDHFQPKFLIIIVFRRKLLHFLLLRINKFDCDFLNRQIFKLAWETTWHPLGLWSRAKMAGIVYKVYSTSWRNSNLSICYIFYPSITIIYLFDLFPFNQKFVSQGSSWSRKHRALLTAWCAPSEPINPSSEPLNAKRAPLARQRFKKLLPPSMTVNRWLVIHFLQFLMLE